VWSANYFAMNGRLVGKFWHGSVANAMAQAIVAQAAFPQRQVISLSGDGGFTMLMGDLLILSQLKPREGDRVQPWCARLHRARTGDAETFKHPEAGEEPSVCPRI
jgi:hypothetical protein